MVENKNLNDINTSAVPSSEDILQFLHENGLINLTDIRDQLTDMNIEKLILENHPHKVWQGSDGRWKTYIDDEKSGKRRQVSSSSKKKLLELINKSTLEEYKESSAPTIRNLYPLWLEHKSLMSAETYIPRVQCDWKKYYENDPIVDIPIDSFNKIELENWVLHLIKDNEMTKTNYYNVTLIIRQIFQFAYDSEIIKDNPFSRVKKDMGKLFKKVKKPLDSTQVYSNEEIQALEEYIWKDYSEKGRKVYRLAPLAVLFQFYTGLRVSEICALKYEDVLPNGNLYVHRMLVRDTGEIRDATKGSVGEREIYLSSKAQEIINSSLEFREKNHISCKEYVFSLSDKPIPERTINDYLERY